MSLKQINEAAKIHAINILGEEQFKKNKNAVKSIVDDFKAGVVYILKQQKTT